MSAVTKRRVLDALRRAAGSLPEAQAAFLFGSHATGRARRESDIDVAFLLDETQAPRARRDRLRRVLDACSATLAADRLDVVILNDAPPALAFQVLKHGELAFERDAIAIHRFRVRTYARHADFEPVERFFREVTRRRARAAAEQG